MNSESARKIRDHLETFYDIPFDVIADYRDGDVVFEIRPQNEEKELFAIRLTIKNAIRLVVEVVPEKYAAFSIADMAEAAKEKGEIFAEYAKQMMSQKAKMDFYINDSPCNAVEPSTWPEKWTSYRLRVSRSPICLEYEQFDEEKITKEWATKVVGMFLSLLNVSASEEYHEGGVKQVIINKYERNPVNRELCLIANGYSCKVCGFNFQKTYGQLGTDYIEVHHIVPVSKMKEEYVINPAKDLIPLCANCHAMIHRKDPPLMPQELADIIQNVSKENNDK